MHKHIPVHIPQTINFCPNSPVCPQTGISDWFAPPPTEKLQIWDDQSLLRFPTEKLQIWDDQSLLRFTPPTEKLQIWDDQSLLRFTPPTEKLQIWDDQSLLWFTPPTEKLQIWDDQSLLRFTPQLKNFRFEMTKVYSSLPPQNWKTSDLRWLKFTPVYPPKTEKLQIWDDQSLLRFTPQLKNFRFEMTKVYSGLLPPKLKNFRFEMTKVYSGLPPPNWKTGRSYVETNL